MKYTLEDISKCDTPDNLWMVVYNKVYDITKFVNEHPGGAEVLFDCGGTDATEAFEDVAHSDDALKMLDPYYMGELDEKDHRVIGLKKNPSSNGGQKKVKRKRKHKHKHKRKLTKLNLPMVILITFACLGSMSYLMLQWVKWSR